MSRNYTTWEEDFSTDRCEFHGLEDELIAIVDLEGQPEDAVWEKDSMWTVRDPAGTLLHTCKTKHEAQRLVEALLTGGKTNG